MGCLDSSVYANEANIATVRRVRLNKIETFEMPQKKRLVGF